MKIRLVHTIGASIAALLLLGGVVGCSSTSSTTSSTKGSSAADQLKQLAEGIKLGRDQLNTTVGTLNALIKNPQTDLANQYKNYTTHLAALEKTAATVEKDSATLASKKGEFIAAWNADIAKIQNEDLRKKATKRQATIAEEFDDLSKEFSDVKAKFNPVLAKLKDVQVALGSDLTVAGVKSVSSLADDASDDIKSLNKAFDKLAAHAQDIRASLVPPGTPAT